MNTARRWIAAALAIAASAMVACSDGAEPNDDTTDVGVSDVHDATDARPDDAGGDTGLDAAGSGEDAGGGADVAPVDASPDIPEGVEMGACGPEWPTQLLIASGLEFVREDAPGVSRGFDLDERVSDPRDTQGCRKNDHTTPEGADGVDNQIGLLMPLLDAAGGDAVEGLIHAAITEGDLLIAMQLGNLDSLENDDCVTFTLGRAVGAPFVGTDGEILDGQTFDRDLEAPSTTIVASIVDGRIVARDFEITLPVYIFFYEFAFPLSDGRIALEIAPDGTATGLLGGAVPVPMLLELIDEIEVNGGLKDVARNAIRTLADMHPDDDGTCQALSVTVDFKTVTAFWFGD